MTTFTFNDRNTYVAFRRQWKTRYAELSMEIRQLRNEAAREAKAGNVSRAAYAQSAGSLRSRDAREMLEQLVEAKQEAQRQYLAAREAKEAA